MSSSAPDKPVTVIGAGMVGLCCGHYLQREGYQVTLVDPRPPGRGSSFGNAGAIASGSVLPTATPELWRELPTLLTDPLSPLRVRWSYLPRMLPWLARFLWSSRPSNMLPAAIALQSLGERALPAFYDLLGAGGSDGLIRDQGWLQVYKTPQSFAGSARQRELMTRLNVPFEVLSAAELRQLEPALAPVFSHAILETGSGFIRNPGRLTALLAERFIANGGRLLTETVRHVEVGESGPRRLITDLGIYPLSQLVVAAGAWSRDLAAQLGAKVVLDTERGYHLNLVPSDEGLKLSRSTYIADHSFVLAPMEDGIRLTSGDELAGLQAAADFRAIKRMLPLAHEVLPGLGNEINREWMGMRPSTPDSLPVIAPAPLPRCYLAFGHGHLGMTFGPITGQLIADLVVGRPPRIDLSPFHHRRFG